MRGISRAEVLQIVLAEHWEEHIQELMARKDAYYRKLIQGIRSEDLLPGARENGYTVSATLGSRRTTEGRPPPSGCSLNPGIPSASYVETWSNTSPRMWPMPSGSNGRNRR